MRRGFLRWDGCGLRRCRKKGELVSQLGANELAESAKKADCLVRWMGSGGLQNPEDLSEPCLGRRYSFGAIEPIAARFASEFEITGGYYEPSWSSAFPGDLLLVAAPLPSMELAEVPIYP